MRSRTATTAAIILSLAAAGAPAASASPGHLVPPNHQSPAAVYSRPNKSTLPTSATAGGDFLAPAAPPVVARVQAPQSGFDWGDAGVGAAGLALTVIGIGGAFVVSQRRSRRSTAVPN